MINVSNTWLNNATPGIFFCMYFYDQLIINSEVVYKNWNEFIFVVNNATFIFDQVIPQTLVNKTS